MSELKIQETQNTQDVQNLQNSQNTPCKFCVYAIYDRITQTGFGITIVEAYDEEKEFYLIKNKVCIYYRSKEIFKDYTKEQIAKQNQFKFDSFIYIDNNSTLEQIQQSLDSLLNQTLQPTRIVFILNNGQVKPSQLRVLGHTIPQTIKWKTEIIINADLGIYSSTDFVATQLKKEISHYSIIRAGTKLPSNTLYDFNNSIINKLECLLLIYLNEEEYIVSKHTHRMLGGNVENSLVIKLNLIGDENKCRKINYQ
jgi:hypothetical protein